MACHWIKTGLLAAALTTTAALAFSGSAQAQAPGYRCKTGCRPRVETPVPVAPVVYVYPQRPWVWTADGWRYPAPASVVGAGLLLGAPGF